jgi:hypothetical protein
LHLKLSFNLIVNSCRNSWVNCEILAEVYIRQSLHYFESQEKRHWTLNRESRIVWVQNISVLKLFRIASLCSICFNSNWDAFKMRLRHNTHAANNTSVHMMITHIPGHCRALFTCSSFYLQYALILIDPNSLRFIQSFINYFSLIFIEFLKFCLNCFLLISRLK